MYYKKVVLNNKKNKWGIKDIVYNISMQINKKDKFTDLYNRNYFFYCLGEKKNGTLIRIRFIGISYVNLQYGRKEGDAIIKHIAKGLKNMQHESLVARLSGSKFGVYTENTDVNYIKKLIDDIFLIASNVSDSSKSIKLSANIAAIIYKYDDFNLSDSINKLEMSMSDAIKKGNNKYEIYNEKYETHINIGAIEKAIEEGEITLYYQPKVDAKTGEIKGVEALIRWFNKEHGYITPEKLIGFAEKCGYINILGKWIIKRACEDIQKLNILLNENIDLSINISPYQLEDKQFVEGIKEIIEEIKFDYKLLKLEITENENMESIDRIHDILGEIKNTGIKVSIDDFGKGFNSIDYIKNYNIDEIKIDKTLIEYLSNNPMFVENLISMIHTTNTSVVAEGVEQKSQYISLQDMGCDLVQGYYCYRPMELEKLLEIVRLNLSQVI